MHTHPHHCAKPARPDHAVSESAPVLLILCVCKHPTSILPLAMLDSPANKARMPRPLTPAQSEQNAAFLRELRRTGNARASAQAIGVHRAALTRRRAKHPAFAAAWDAALAFVHARLEREPRAHLTPSGRRQIRRVAAGGITDAVEQRFLLALSATANIRLSARAAGFSPASFYVRRGRDPAFAEQWRDALAQGYDRVERALLDAGLARDAPRDAWARNEPPALPPMTPAQALQLLYLHQK